METGFLFRISAFAAESITFCITAAMCIVTGYIDGSCGAFAVFIVGAVVCFAVNLDRVAATAICEAVHGTAATLTEAAAAGFICTGGTFAHDVDLVFGAELVFVVKTGCCGTS